LDLTRRSFFKFITATSVIGLTTLPKSAMAYHRKEISPEWLGVLVDTTVCIGCRRCEWACQNINGLPNQPIYNCEDKSVFEHKRRPDIGAYTVINKYDNPKNPERHYYVKVQCMHCNDAACVSACIVGALKKDEKTGAVVYDPWKCMGCRYCMAACPFQIPAYDYQDPLTPQVRKCNFCFTNLNKYNRKPACVEICPMETMLVGKRTDLLKIAHDRIKKYPDRYVDHIYGEEELGGTSWIYLSGRPIWEMDLKQFDDRPIPSYTEIVQHSLFKNFIPPLALFAVLSSLMWIFRKQEKYEEHDNGGNR
jgi:formate dehydrogenase iron-sulfur subunit